MRNPDPDEGQVSSQRLGLAALAGKLDAVIVALADQPLITAQDIDALVGAWQTRGDGIAVVHPEVDGERGNPLNLDSVAALHAAVRSATRDGARVVVLAAEGRFFFAPAYPLETVFDPTGAGDTFAGGFMGVLARSGTVTEATLRRAIVYGSVMASFAVEDFSLDRLKRLSEEEIEARYRAFQEMTRFGE